jgi:glycolate oxidase subunit GlcD
MTGLSAGAAAALAGVVGREWVRSSPRDLLAYSYDATGEKHLPAVVVFPARTEEVAACIAVAREHGLSVVPRGAATNLSGGALPLHRDMVVNLVRMHRILSLDPVARRARVEAGVVNLDLQRAAAPHGLLYAPDPSSMKVATIGGSLAENAGGPRCAKYGVSVNHVEGLRLVLADSSIVDIGGGGGEAQGLDLVPTVVGSEGTLAIITEAEVRLTPLPRDFRTLTAVFATLPAAAAAVSATIAARILPAALELLDRNTVEVINRFANAGFPEDAEALLLLELDGESVELDGQFEHVLGIMKDSGAVELRLARTPEERDALWAARRAGYGALAYSSPSLMAMDVTVPRDQLVPMMEEVLRLSEEFALKVHLVAHAGDGNMHPTVPFDPADEDEVRRLHALAAAVMRACVGLGGSISGEHGIGIEKLEGMSVQYDAEVLEAMWAVRRAFDPLGLFNPGKAVPQPAAGW